MSVEIPPPYYNPDSLRPFLVDPDPAHLRMWLLGIQKVQAHGANDPRLSAAFGLGADFTQLLGLCADMPVPYGVYVIVVYLFCTQAAQDKLPPADVAFLEQIKNEWGVWATGHQATGAMYTAADQCDRAHTVAFAWRMQELYRNRYQHAWN